MLTKMMKQIPAGDDAFHMVNQFFLLSYTIQMMLGFGFSLPVQKEYLMMRTDTVNSGDLNHFQFFHFSM